MDADDLDHRVRMAAFAFLADQTRHFGDVVPRPVLATGFVFEGTALLHGRGRGAGRRRNA